MVQPARPWALPCGRVAPRRWPAARLFACLAAASLLVGASGPAAAGTQAGAEEVREELDKTAEVLERASEFIRDSGVTAAHEHFQSALQFQASAKKQYLAGRDQPKPERYFARAIELTLRARQEAQRAMDLARVALQTEDSVRQSIDQTAERADEVGRLVREANDPQARPVFDQALDHLNRARLADADRDLVQAARLVAIASNLLDRAARLAQNRVTAGASAAASIERTAALLGEVENALAESGRRADDVPLLQEARRLLARAREAQAAGQLRGALQASLAARQRALQLMGDLQQDPGRPRLLEAITELEALYAELGPEIEAAGGEAEKSMLDEGRRTLGRARELLERDRHRQALQHLLAAEGLLKKAARSAGL